LPQFKVVLLTANSVLVLSVGSCSDSPCSGTRHMPDVSWVLCPIHLTGSPTGRLLYGFYRTVMGRIQPLA